MTSTEANLYWVNTTVISEVRKHSKENRSARDFFKHVTREETRVSISVVTVGELRRVVESIRYRGDTRQANQLEK